MPCVFSVLAIKALSMAKLAGEAGSAIRAQTPAYTTGVEMSSRAILKCKVSTTVGTDGRVAAASRGSDR
jgi:hypothetical protein